MGQRDEGLGDLPSATGALVNQAPTGLGPDGLRSPIAIHRERFGVVFRATAEFQALRDAEAFLADAGFSVGAGQRGAPTAVMFGDYAVSKWRNLNHDQRRETHATLTGDNRLGPLTLRLLPAAPDAAVQALEAAIARATPHKDL